MKREKQTGCLKHNRLPCETPQADSKEARKKKAVRMNSLSLNQII